jgi:hypothetical protein
MDLNLESMLMGGVGIRQIRGGHELEEEPLFRARGGELQSGLVPTRAIVGGDQSVAVLVIHRERFATGTQNPRFHQDRVSRDQPIRYLFRATARRRSLPFAAELLQLLECFRGSQVLGLRLQLKRRSARHQKNQEHQPICFHIARLVGSHREGKKPMCVLRPHCSGRRAACRTRYIAADTAAATGLGDRRLYI